MSVVASPEELERTYEALRAQAVGVLPAGTPRGQAVLRRAGLVAWMRACPPLAPLPRPAAHVDADPATPSALVRGELVALLTEMALAAGRSWCT